MDIHRTGKVADWYIVPEATRNKWQKIASATHGYITPGNFVSVVGASIATVGFVWLYRGNLSAGLMAVAIGRFCDILDGYVAHYTGTKSSLGEAVDAGLDKIVVLVAFLVFINTDIVPFWLVMALAAQQFVATALSGYARLRHMGLHPSKLGKVAMAAQWVIILGYILAAINVSVSTPVMWLLHVLFSATILAGTIATYGYARHITRFNRRHA